jgi:cell division protein FtsQ
MSPLAKPKLGIRMLQAFAGVAVVAVLATIGVYGYRTVISHPIARVVYAGELDRLPQAELDALTQAVLSAERPSLEGVRAAAMLVPWVRDASVRRLYPDAVEVRFTTREAVARWDDKHLVSREGVVFEAQEARALPRLRGPDGTAPRLVAEFPALSAAFAPLGRLAELRLTPRGAWEAVLDSGLTLELGRGDWKPRVEHFVAAWPRLSEDARAAKYADLRYANGFALRTATALAAPVPGKKIK